MTLTVMSMSPLLVPSDASPLSPQPSPTATSWSGVLGLWGGEAAGSELPCCWGESLTDESKDESSDESKDESSDESSAGAAEGVTRLGRGQRLGGDLGGFRPQLEGGTASGTAADEDLRCRAEGRSSTVALGTAAPAAVAAVGALVGVVGAAAVSVVAVSIFALSVLVVLLDLVSDARGARKIISAMASVLRAAAAWRASCGSQRGRVAGQGRAGQGRAGSKWSHAEVCVRWWGLLMVCHTGFIHVLL
jgi:hypothetical protein